MGDPMMWGLLVLSALAAPFAVPAAITLVATRYIRRRRESLAARSQVGRLGEGS